MSAVQQRTEKAQGIEFWIVLLTVSLMSVFYYGIRAAAVMGLAAVTAMLTDLVCLFLQGKHYQAEHLSSVCYAVIMVLMFPATIPYSIVIFSTIFMVAAGIRIFGSQKNLLFPPPALGYLFALASWKHEVLAFPKAGQFLHFFGNTVSVHPSLSSTFNAEGYYQTGNLDVMLGAVYGPMGTGCLLLLLLGLAVMLLRRNISAGSTLGFLSGIVLSATASGTDPLRLLSTNMLLFAALFLTGNKTFMPADGIAAGVCGFFTAVLTVLLIQVFHVEYGILAAVVLSGPVWRAIAERTGTPAAEGGEASDEKK